MNPHPSTSARQSSLARGVGSWFVPPVLLAAAVLLLVDPWRYLSPIPPRRETPAWAVDITPVRHPSLTPEITFDGNVYRCTACHALFPSPPETDRPLTQHLDIKLEHGINNRCFNCHHREDRDALVDYRGERIAYDQPQLLCGKCHGPVYRDWTHGVHGRTNGYWDVRQGKMDRKRCIQCHDPHSPAFGSLGPAPGPNTLRMGRQEAKPDLHEEQKNPLLIYRQALPQSRNAE